MNALAALLVGLCLGATPPQVKREGSKPHERAAPGAPGAARRAALESTLARRRAYRERFRGTARLQQAQVAPLYQSMMLQLQQMAAAET
jgi:hypothetical protein